MVSVKREYSYLAYNVEDNKPYLCQSMNCSRCKFSDSRNAGDGLTCSSRRENWLRASYGGVDETTDTRNSQGEITW